MKIKLTDLILVSVATGAIYSFSYFYQVGILSYYNLPFFFIEINLSNIISSMISIFVLFLTALTIISGINFITPRSFYKTKNKNDSLQNDKEGHNANLNLVERVLHLFPQLPFLIMGGLIITLLPYMLGFYAQKFQTEYTLLKNYQGDNDIIILSVQGEKMIGREFNMNKNKVGNIFYCLEVSNENKFEQTKIKISEIKD